MTRTATYAVDRIEGTGAEARVVLVAAAAPALLVVSVGEGNRYGHPHPEALAAWRGPGRRILRTDLDGTVRVRGCADGRFFTTTAREDGR